MDYSDRVDELGIEGFTCGPLDKILLVLVAEAAFKLFFMVKIVPDGFKYGYHSFDVSLRDEWRSQEFRFSGEGGNPNDPQILKRGEDESLVLNMDTQLSDVVEYLGKRVLK